MKKNVIEYLDKTANKYPNKIAVHDSYEDISFSQLIHASFAVSGKLFSLGITACPICVYIKKGCKMVESFAGISRSGNFYVPLDTKSPNSRIQGIINVLNPAAIITDKEHYSALSTIECNQILLIEDVLSENITAPINDLQIDTDPVYSIFTSGSTGTPKGVVVSHRGVIDYIDWAIDTFHINSTATIGNQAPFYFDNSTLDIYLMYATGATLNIIPEECFAFPSKLVDYLNEYKVSFVFWVPFVLINVANLNIFESKKPKYLKDVFFAGEIMPNKHLNYWRNHLPECRYANLYGPTEITVDCTYYVVNREFKDDESLPIGLPCRNSNVMILVNRQRLAKIGEEGEICVRGTSLALGYYNNTEKTRESFIQNPLNSHYPETIYCTGDMAYVNEFGEIMYVGRIDSQIKYNGYRIELGEIENAVFASNMVKSCCVSYDFLNKEIVLFYQNEKEIDMGEFRKFLMTKIPKYMVPSIYHKVDEMYLNTNGKIDRLYYRNQVNG